MKPIEIAALDRSNSPLWRIYTGPPATLASGRAPKWSFRLPSGA